ncbi:hypothetical protein J4458_03310 [Candidatus Woesearchaeota archaeon]|nr:hypothetical protein [Candidatus Woesearchaeota archaeon]
MAKLNFRIEEKKVCLYVKKKLIVDLGIKEAEIFCLELLNEIDKIKPVR